MVRSPTTFVFETKGYTCGATVEYTSSLDKYLADSDLDYYGGYDIIELEVYSDGELVEDHTVAHEDVVRAYEIHIDTQMEEFHNDYNSDEDYMWEEA